MKRKKIRVAVIGVGSIGIHHARIFSELSGADLIGVVDADIKKAEKTAAKFGCKAFNDHMDVLDLVDAATIAVPTTLHHRVANDCLKKSLDILIEKPMTSTVKEADRLIAAAAREKRVLQVGHLERFNAGLSLMSGMIKNPVLIESMRLSPFLGRGADVDVTLDLMIHDIDIILSLVRSEITDLRATGARVLTGNIDIAYAWVEFRNGCIAEVVASRIAAEKIRQLKVFQHNAHMKLNYQTQEVSWQKKTGGQIREKTVRPAEKEPLKEQLASFIKCVKNRTMPVVSGAEGREALKVALKISEMINAHPAEKRKQN